MGDLPHKRNRYLTRFQELWRLREHKVVENKSTKTVLTHLHIKNDAAFRRSSRQASRKTPTTTFNIIDFVLMCHLRGQNCHFSGTIEQTAQG